MNEQALEAMAEAIYDTMFDGYAKRPWSEASAMDQFRCRRSAAAALRASGLSPKAHILALKQAEPRREDLVS